MKRKLALLITFISISILLMAGNIPDMKFRRLDSRNGLTTSQVNCIYKDQQGFLWLGTSYGLYRYDGFRFRNYFSNSPDAQSLGKDYVDKIYEAYDGKLWIEQSSYYSVYDPRTERFDNHPKELLHHLAGITGGVEKLCIDSRHNFWVKTYNKGCYYYNPFSKNLIRFAYGKGQLPRNITISNFCQYGMNMLAITNKGDVYCMSIDEGKVIWMSHYIPQYTHHAQADYRGYLDIWGNLWVMARGDECFIYCKSTHKWYNSLSDFLRSRGFAGVPNQIKVWDVKVDHHKRLWVATDHLGMMVIDLASRTFRFFTNNPDDETSLSDISARSIYVDKGGHVWIATYKNSVNEYIENSQLFKTCNIGDIDAICEDNEGNYWLGTNDKGIIRYQPKTGAQTLYNKQNSGFLSNIIVSSFRANDGSLWFGTFNGGLIHYKGGKFQTYTAATNPELKVNNIWSITQDKQGNIWLGTLGTGFVRMDVKIGKFRSFNMHHSKVASDYLASIFRMPDGRILAGTSSYAQIINPVTYRITNITMPQGDLTYTPSPSSSHVIMDSRGLIWQGSPSGVCIYNSRTRKTDAINTDSGLKSLNISALIEDDSHRVWVISDYGIACVSPEKIDGGDYHYSVRTYNTRDGLMAGPYNQRAVCKTHDGLILVGSQQGISIINPRLVGRSVCNQLPIFSGLLVYGKSLSAGDEYDGHVVYQESLNENGHLELAYSEKQFTVLLATSQCTIHNHARFAYRLQGLNDKWIHLDSDDPQISFNNLPSGHYVLQVRMLNDDGSLGKEERQLQITIAPPFWFSWWAILLYLILMGIGGYYARKRYLEHRSALQQMEKIKREEEKKREIETMKRDIYEGLGEDLAKPFEDAFGSINSIMSKETSEERYEAEQQVYSGIENLLVNISELGARDNKSQKIVPQITEEKIESLDEKFVKEATRYVEENLSNTEISVETMSEKLGMSRVHLYKRMLAITGVTPSEFIRQIRLRHAEQLLRRSQLTISEISYQVGFNYPRYFSKYFKEMYGVMPSQYKIEHDENK